MTQVIPSRALPTKGELAMATLNVSDVTDFLRMADETGISLSVLGHHLRRLKERGVCEKQLTLLHRSGLDADLMEVVKQGRLDQVDRIVFRHVLGLSPKDVMSSFEFPVLKTIKLGTHKDVKVLQKALLDAGFKISDWGNKIFNKIPLAVSEMEATLHVATVKELTGKDIATNREINEAIRSKGYDLCPAEVGPQLRLQYPDQPKGGWLRIGMEPITDSDGGLNVFGVGHDSVGRWLHGINGHPDIEWCGGNRFVFVSRK